MPLSCSKVLSHSYLSWHHFAFCTSFYRELKVVFWTTTATTTTKTCHVFFYPRKSYLFQQQRVLGLKVSYQRPITLVKLRHQTNICTSFLQFVFMTLLLALTSSYPFNNHTSHVFGSSREFWGTIFNFSERSLTFLNLSRTFKVHFHIANNNNLSHMF